MAAKPQLGVGSKAIDFLNQQHMYMIIACLLLDRPLVVAVQGTTLLCAALQQICS